MTRKSISQSSDGDVPASLIALPCAASRVRLKSFNGTLEAPAECKPEENYWRLIGQSGVAVASSSAARALVVFNAPVSAAGLHCHNEIANSLLILWTDLEVAP